MPQGGTNFLESFIRGRMEAQNLESAKNEEERRKEEFKLRQQELKDVIERRKAQDSLTRLQVEDYLRQQLISGERNLPSIQAGISTPEGVLPGAPGSENTEMIRPEPFSISPGDVVSPRLRETLRGMNIQAPLGTYEFSPSDISSARTNIREQLLSQGRTAAEIAGMKEAELEKARFPGEFAKIQGRLVEEEIRAGGRADIEDIRDLRARDIAEAQITARKTLEEYKQGQANYRARLKKGTANQNASARVIAGAHDNNALTKRAIIGQEAISFVDALDPKTESSADDIGLIYAFAKAMDPESVVREGEYNTIQKYAQSWREKFGFDIQRILANREFLTPEARINLKKTIQTRANATLGQYNQYRKSIINRINISSDGQINGEKFLGVSPADFVIQKKESKAEAKTRIVGGKTFIETSPGSNKFVEKK